MKRNAIHDDDIQPLAETLQLRPHETPASFVSRLAAMNAAGNAREFCKDFYLDFEKIARGDPEELRRLSAFASVDYDTLVTWAPTAIEKGFTINGEHVAPHRSRRTRMRMCLKCAQEDMAAAPHVPPDAAVACPAHFLVDSIRTCHRHNLSLVQISDQRSLGEHHGDYTMATSDFLEDLDVLEELVVERTVSDFELYLLGRIGIVSSMSAPILDTMDLNCVARTCQYLGVYALHGAQGQMSSLNEDELQAAAQAGFAPLAQGEEAIKALIRDRHARTSSTSRRLAAGALGNLRCCLQEDVNGQLQDLKQIVVDALSELEPYGPDDPPIFGVRARKRHWHTAESAAREYGLPARTILGDLRRAGINSARGPNGFLDKGHKMAVEAVDALYRGRDGHISQHRVFQTTGIESRFLSAFEESGLIVPVRPSNGKRNSALFRKGDIEDMLRIFDDVAPERRCGELEGMVNLTDAYLESNWSLAEVLQLLVRNKVPSHRLPTYRLFEALRLDLEVLRALHPFYGKENMSVEQAAEFLGIGDSTVSRLVATGALPSHRTRAPRHSLLRRSILKSDVADFGQRYISISEIYTLGIPLRKARRWLQSLGCQPVLFDPSVRCTFYHRGEVEPHLKNFPK